MNSQMYQDWLMQRDNSLAEEIKCLELQVAQRRKMKKSLMAKQRTVRMMSYLFLRLHCFLLGSLFLLSPLFDLLFYSVLVLLGFRFWLCSYFKHIHSFIHSGDLYGASSRDYYSEEVPAKSAGFLFILILGSYLFRSWFSQYILASCFIQIWFNLVPVPLCVYFTQIHSFIQATSIVPLQVHYTQSHSRHSTDTVPEFHATFSCEGRTCPKSLCGGSSRSRTHDSLDKRRRLYQCATHTPRFFCLSFVLFHYCLTWFLYAVDIVSLRSCCTMFLFHFVLDSSVAMLLTTQLLLHSNLVSLGSYFTKLFVWPCSCVYAVLVLLSSLLEEALIRGMLNKFHLRYTAVVLKSNDWRFPSIWDLEATWRYPSHSHIYISVS